MLFRAEEACLLMQKLEEVFMRVAQGHGSDYLTILTRAKGCKDDKQALQKLQAVRLALAKYYARCSAIGTGGRSDPADPFA